MRLIYGCLGDAGNVFAFFVQEMRQLLHIRTNHKGNYGL